MFPCARKLWQKILDLQKEANDRKMLAEQSERVKATLEKISGSSDGDVDLEKVKAEVQGFPDLTEMLQLLNDGGVEGAKSAQELTVALTTFIDWSEKVVCAKFTEALDQMTLQVEANFPLPDDASMAKAAELFVDLPPVLPEVADKPFLLQCCLAHMLHAFEDLRPSGPC